MSLTRHLVTGLLLIFVWVGHLYSVPALNDGVLAQKPPPEVVQSLSEALIPPIAPTLTTAPAPTGSLNLTVSPITVTLETLPGAPTSNNVKIRNNGNETEYLKAELYKFTADATGERPAILDFEPEEEYKNWLQVSEPAFSVRPGEWKTITVTFSPPDTASLNYFYAVAFNRQTKPEVAPGETGLAGAPAVLVLSNVRSPNTKRELQLVEFSAPKVFFEFLPIEFSVKVKNTGNTFLAPTGNVFIDGNGKKDIAILEVNSGLGNILPASERTYKANWSDGFPVSVRKVENKEFVTNAEGNPVYTLEWDFSKADRLRIGKYTANLLLVYDNGERDVPLESSVSFWVVPWRILAGGLVVAALALLGLRSVIMPVIHKITALIKR